MADEAETRATNQRTSELRSVAVEDILRTIAELTNGRYVRLRESQGITEDELYQAKLDWCNAELALAYRLEGQGQSKS